jgi:hypothetical protein
MNQRTNLGDRAQAYSIGYGKGLEEGRKQGIAMERSRIRKVEWIASAALVFLMTLAAILAAYWITMIKYNMALGLPDHSHLSDEEKVARNALFPRKSSTNNDFTEDWEKEFDELSGLEMVGNARTYTKFLDPEAVKGFIMLIIHNTRKDRVRDALEAIDNFAVREFGLELSGKFQTFIRKYRDEI